MKHFFYYWFLSVEFLFHAQMGKIPNRIRFYYLKAPKKYSTNME